MDRYRNSNTGLARKSGIKPGLLLVFIVFVASLMSSTSYAQNNSQHSDQNRTYVLVHGAWHGGWVWKFVASSLRARGHTVYAPTLTGLGDRSHLYNADIDVSVHVQDVVSLIEMEDLSEVVLVGWSYGGMVATGTLARVQERIASMVYLDAFWPENGQSVLDMQPPNRRAFYEKHSAEKKPIPPIPLKAFGVTDPKMVAFAQPRLRPQPPLTLTRSVVALPMRPKNIPHTYIRAIGFDPSPFKAIAVKKVKPDPSITYAEINTGHDAMLIAPETLARMLHEVR